MQLTTGDKLLNMFPSCHGTDELQEKKDAFTFTADVQKFKAVVNTWSTKIKEKEDALVEKEKELYYLRNPFIHCS
ncbi:hypothetical protein ZWY2020_019837 [Hordeum vulgare]|nr:hypothetical protein ZWY2020_019837 [Hordeum vulgare]